MEMQTLGDILRVHGAARPQQTALVFEERRTCWAELDCRANRVANGLLAAGIAPQARITILDKNSDAFYELLFGAARAGVALAAVNYRLAPAEIAYVIHDTAAEILFAGPEYAETIRQIRNELPRVKTIIALGADAEWAPYAAWRDRQSDAPPAYRAQPQDVAMQLYTSGTTGRPKGAQLTHHNLICLLQSALVDWGNWSERDISLAAMPMYHIGGSGWGLLALVAGGCTVMTREVIPAQILQIIERERITKAFLVPAVILFLLQTPGVEETDFSSVDTLIYGASPMPPDLIRRAMEVMKCPFAQVYGLTETTGAITYLRPEEHRLDSPRLRSCGRPHSIAEIAVVNGEGHRLPPGQVGEIICRSPQNMKGYWNLPAATAQTIRGEWLYTGDAGYLDADGYLYIHDRVKDMIISGGENIYPTEVEAALCDHPAVADAAVIGVPDATWGESVKAIVVRRPGSTATAEELIAFVRDRIAHYKAPKSVEFVDALPRNPSGKILKRILREPYWQGRERMV